MRYLTVFVAILILSGASPVLAAPHLAAGQEVIEAPPPQGVTVELLGQGEPAAAPGQALALARVTFAPGAAAPGLLFPGAFVYFVASGAVTVTPLQGAVTVSQAPAGGLFAAEQIVAEGDEVTLEAGDTLVGDRGALLAVETAGGDPAVAVISALADAGEPPVLFVPADREELLADGDEVPAPRPTPDLAAVAAAPAPAALADIELPDDAAAIQALFERLPPTIAGDVCAPPRLQDDRFEVTCGAPRAGAGPPVMLRAIDLTAGDFFPPNWTAEDVIAFRLLAADGEDAPVAGGREDDLFWLLDETYVTGDVSADRYSLYGLTWGEAGSSWIFAASADMQEGLEALVAAFVDAAEVAEA